jgi:hypothetical protein
MLIIFRVASLLSFSKEGPSVFSYLFSCLVSSIHLILTTTVYFKLTFCFPSGVFFLQMTKHCNENAAPVIASRNTCLSWLQC